MLVVWVLFNKFTMLNVYICVYGCGQLSQHYTNREKAPLIKGLFNKECKVLDY